MKKLLNISERTNVILHALGYIAAYSEKGKPVSSQMISSYIKVPRPYLAKILQPLVKDGILISTKGTGGGFLLKEDLLDHSLFDIFSLLGEDLTDNFCLMDKPICKKESCIFTELNEKIRAEIESALKSKALRDFSRVI